MRIGSALGELGTRRSLHSRSSGEAEGRIGWSSIPAHRRRRRRKRHHISVRRLRHGVLIHGVPHGERRAGTRRHHRNSARRWSRIPVSPTDALGPGWSGQQAAAAASTTTSSQQRRDDARAGRGGGGSSSRGGRGSLPLARRPRLPALRRSRRLQGSMAATFAPLGDICREDEGFEGGGRGRGEEGKRGIWDGP